MSPFPQWHILSARDYDQLLADRDRAVARAKVQRRFTEMYLKAALRDTQRAVAAEQAQAAAEQELAQMRQAQHDAAAAQAAADRRVQLAAVAITMVFTHAPDDISLGNARDRAELIAEILA